jgi:hypothetical protein
MHPDSPLHTPLYRPSKPKKFSMSMGNISCNEEIHLCKEILILRQLSLQLGKVPSLRLSRFKESEHIHSRWDLATRFAERHGFGLSVGVEGDGCLDFLVLDLENNMMS